MKMTMMMMMMTMKMMMVIMMLKKTKNKLYWLTQLLVSPLSLRCRPNLQINPILKCKRCRKRKLKGKKMMMMMMTVMMMMMVIKMPHNGDSMGDKCKNNNVTLNIKHKSNMFFAYLQ